MMDVVVIAGAIRHAKLQLIRHHHQQTKKHSFLQARYRSCRPTNSVKALKANVVPSTFPIPLNQFAQSLKVRKIRFRSEEWMVWANSQFANI